jgi:hypothetical protein
MISLSLVSADRESEWAPSCPAPRTNGQIYCPMLFTVQHRAVMSNKLLKDCFRAYNFEQLGEIRLTIMEISW